MQQKLMLRIISSPNQISKLDSYVLSLKAECNLSQETHDNILISLTEAVNNAIIHGNKQDQKKYVNINCVECQTKVIIRITDEGAGFNPHQVADPTLVENRSCCGGRGVYIMKQLSDAIQFLDNGRTVEMHFNTL